MGRETEVQQSGDRVSQQTKQLEDRISRLESDLKQFMQRIDAEKRAGQEAIAASLGAVNAMAESVKRGPGRPKKAE